MSAMMDVRGAGDGEVWAPYRGGETELKAWSDRSGHALEYVCMGGWLVRVNAE